MLLLVIFAKKKVCKISLPHCKKGYKKGSVQKITQHDYRAESIAKEERAIATPPKQIAIA